MEAGRGETEKGGGQSGLDQAFPARFSQRLQQPQHIFGLDRGEEAFAAVNHRRNALAKQCIPHQAGLQVGADDDGDIPRFQRPFRQGLLFSVLSLCHLEQASLAAPSTLQKAADFRRHRAGNDLVGPFPADLPFLRHTGKKTEPQRRGRKNS